MIRKPILATMALVLAVPAFAHNTQVPASQFAAGQTQPTLRLMNDDEFATFLQRLDAELVHAQLQMKKMDVGSMKLDAQGKQDLMRSYERCLESLDDARGEIQKLGQKQTLKLDLYLLIDLNELARNLDALDETLVNSAASNSAAGMQKPLAYARAVLSIDGSLAAQISTFQNHFIAFTGAVDATLQQPDSDDSESPIQK
jgi:hypothetical protein